MKGISRNNTGIYLFNLLLVHTIICMYGSNTISSLIVGIFIILLFYLDLRSFPYKFHLYQIVLIYFYYTLVIAHNYNYLIDKYAYYQYAYYITVLGFISFIAGYHILRYNISDIIQRPKQNKLLLIYLIITTITSLIVLINTVDVSEANSYASRFLQYHETRNLDIYKSGYNNIKYYFEAIIYFFLNNPIFYSIIKIIDIFVAYIGTGQKLAVISCILSSFIIFQVFYKRIYNIHMNIIFAFAVLFTIFLIGTTIFRGNLTLKGFISIFHDTNFVLNFKSFLSYFLYSPESNHVIYFAHIIELINTESLDYRYGFDYYRFFLYPFKNEFINYELASYNQYPVIVEGKLVSKGLYLGLITEIFWNFGWVFPIIAFGHGLLLKIFTNIGFSGKLFSFVVYIIFFDRMLLHFVRGQFNTLLMHIIFLVIGIIFFLILYKCYLHIPYKIRKFILIKIPNKHNYNSYLSQN